MKKEFSTKWIGSKHPRKQRKYLANAPLHIRHKLISVNLSKDLRKKYGKRNFPLRKDDEVRVMKGEFKGKTGKIESVDLKKLRVKIVGINRTKKDGTKLSVYFNSSNLQIKELNLEDRKRIQALERKSDSKLKKEQKDDKEIKKIDGKEKEETKKIKFKPLPKEVKNVSEKK